MIWKNRDRVKVTAHHPTGLGGRLGTVLRITPGGYIEVDLDSWHQAGIGVVAFRPEHLKFTNKKPGWWKAREERRKNNPTHQQCLVERAQVHHGRNRE